MKGSLLTKSGLMALAFGAEAAAAASSTVQDPAAAAAPAQPAPAPAAAAGEKKDPPAAESGADEGGEKKEPVAPAAATAKEIDPAAAQTGDMVFASTALEGMAEARAKGQDEGFAAANERCRLVLESAEGQANPADAMFMLFHSDANAATINGNLKTRAAGGKAPARQVVQPRINLTGGNGAAAAAGEGEHDGDPAAGFDPWAHVAALKQPSQFAESALVIGGQTLNLTPQQAQ